MSLVKEFRDFAVKGNVVDMAIGIIIGAAFGKIVSSAVADVIMPPLGLIIGGVNFTGLEVVLKHAADGSAAVALKYGNFLQQVFDFVIVALAMFSVIKVMNRIKKSAEAAPAPSNQELLLSEIRDILKQK